MPLEFRITPQCPSDIKRREETLGHAVSANWTDALTLAQDEIQSDMY